MERFFDPIFAFFISAVLALAVGKWWSRRVGRVLFCIGLGWFFLFVVTPLPTWLCARFERSVPAERSTALQRDASIPVLVLGGGTSDDPSLENPDRLTPSSRARLLAALVLQRKAPGRKVVFSGSPISGTLHIADVMADSALRLGLSASDTLLLRNGRNTREEAAVFCRRFGNKPFFLVTDAIHMPRAVSTFRALGLKPLPMPCNYVVQFGVRSSPYSWWPDFAKAMITKRLLHEYVGILYYRLT